MTLTDQYDGSTAPFEGDRTILWRSLPSNAQVTKATVSVATVAAPGGTLFQEVISFTGGQGDFGTTKNLGSGFVEVDFHKRRTLAAVDGAGVRPTGSAKGANLQVDLGGLYVEINDKGAIRVPNDNPFPVPADGSLPGLTVSKFKLTPGAGSPNIDVSSVVIHSVATNLSVRIGTSAPFWLRAGELSTSDTSPDFSAVLQAYLAHAQVVNGFYAVPLVIHSDAVARLLIDLNVEFVSQASLQPAGVKEVVVPFDFSTLPKTEANVLSVALPPNARVLPGLTSAKVAGAFQETRIAHGVPPGAPVPPFAVRISPAESQGQIIGPDISVSATAVDVLLSASTPSALVSVDLRRDLDGKPDGVSVLSKPVELSLHADVTQQPSWMSIPLPAEFNFASGARYWLVLVSLEGEALWSTQPSSPGATGVQHTLDGGLSWHYSGSVGASGPLEASFRLRNKPPLFQVPVQLNVGTGNQSAAVSLDRYQPLGKVDFTIDTPDLAGAFNQYLSSGVPPACPQGEHLVNGDFEQWAVSGNQVGTAFTIDLDGGASALATTSDGHWTYASGLFGDQNAGVSIIDSICDEPLADVIQLQGASDPLAIAVNPSGDRLYVVSEDSLSVVDATARAQLGTALTSAALAALLSTITGASPAFDGEIAVSPDGTLIYLTFGIQSAISVLSIPANALEENARGLKPLSRQDVRGLAIPGTAAEAMALSPDGTRLYVAMQPSTSVSVIDTASFRISGTGIDTGDQPGALAFTPDGKLALVVTTGKDTRLHLIDTASETDSDFIVVGTELPVAVVVSPDGTRGYALLSPPEIVEAVGITESEDTAESFSTSTETPPEAGSTLVPVDLERKLPAPAIPLNAFGVSMAITPQGDRIYIAAYVGDGGSELVVVPLGERTPAEWFVTSDTPTIPARVLPACLAGVQPFDLALVFAQSLRPFQPNTVAAGLSQVVPVSGPCSYEFSFYGYADDSGALAEIFWLDQKSTLLRTDTLPVQLQPEIASASLGTAHSLSTAGTPQFVLHRARFTSPAGAAQAEVRFTAPPFSSVVLGQVSLSGTPEVLQNGDLHLAQNGLPEGWTLNAQYSRGVSLNSIDGATRLLNSSAGDAEIVQSSAIGANQQYAFELKAKPVNLPSSVQQPVAELRWLKNDRSAAGPFTTLKLDSSTFLRYPATGTTPAGSAVVEVHLKTPSGTGLDIYQVTLETPQQASVPLTFIAQAPGELRVSRSLVTYDIVPAPPPPVPSQGLATPTPPGSKPGDPPSVCYCSCCGDEQPITQPQMMTTLAGMPVTVGSCPDCGTTLTRPGGPLLAGAPILQSYMLAPHLQGGRRLRLAPAPLPPLTALPGIREGRQRQLAEIGITSLEHLASATPEDVSKAMRGVSPKHAAEFIKKAKGLIASHERSSPVTGINPAYPQPSPDEAKKEN